MTPKPSRTPSQLLLEAIAVGEVVFAAFFLVLSGASIPDRVPSHFGFTGRPDSWGGKYTLVAFPVLAAFFYAGLTAVSFFPRVWNMPVKITPENEARQYGLVRSMLLWLKAEIALNLTFLEWGSVEVAEGKASGLGWAPLIGIAAVFLTVGAHLYGMVKARG